MYYVPCPDGDQALGPLEQAFAWLGSNVCFLFFFPLILWFQIYTIKKIFLSPCGEILLPQKIFNVVFNAHSGLVCVSIDTAKVN
jgi:hypothetical protein